MEKSRSLQLSDLSDSVDDAFTEMGNTGGGVGLQ